MQIGAQLYTVRNFIQTESDMEYSFEKIAKIGYKVVQLSGVGNYDAKKVRAIADKNDLKIVLTHTDAGKIMNNTEAVIEEHNILGADYIGLGYLADKYRDSQFVERFAHDFLPAAQKIKDAGKYFMYHNHAFEFKKIGADKKFIMDILGEIMPADVMGFTVDTFWLQAGGVSVLEWLDKLQARIPCVHLKDMAITENNDQLMAAVGEGNLNFKDILAKLEANGTTKYALVEQDNCYGANPFDCLETSFNNLKKLGY